MGSCLSKGPADQQNVEKLQPPADVVQRRAGTPGSAFTAGDPASIVFKAF